MKNRLTAAFLICLLASGLVLAKNVPPVQNKEAADESVSYVISVVVALSGGAVIYALHRYDAFRQIRFAVAVPLTNLFKGLIGPGAQNRLAPANPPAPDADIGPSLVEVVTSLQVRKLSLEGIKVAVIDDEQINRMVTKRKLSLLGAEVVIGENGEDALLLAVDSDVLLMDKNMPLAKGEAANEDAGLIACKKISEMHGPHAVVIIHSSDNIEESVYRDCGAAEQIHKGVAKIDEYESKIVAALEHAGE